MSRAAKHKKSQDGGAKLGDFETSLPMALLRAREAVMDRFRPVLRKHGVTEQQWRVLRLLDKEDGLDASELAQRCCLLMPSLTRIIRTLEADNMIRRRAHAKDQRRLSLSITPKGRGLIETVAPESEAIYAALFDDAGDVDLAGLGRLLESLSQALNGADRDGEGQA